MHNLLVDPLIRVCFTNGTADTVCLPEVYAAMVADRVAAFPALRRHQRHAWHAFLAQLGAIALHRADWAMPPPDSADEWRRLLRRTTREFYDDEPWNLVVEQSAKPAFMQCPAPRGLREYTASRTTPDDLDILFTNKNHHLKQTVAVQGAPDDWIFALVNVQTMAGYRGGGNYGIARMNGGFSGRPCLGLAPADGGLGAHLAHDIRRMLEYRETLLDRYPFESDVGLALLWLHRWDGKDALALRFLDPYFIEICRRIRLQAHGAGICARTAGSRGPRVDAKGANGEVGDFWTPVRDENGEAFTVSVVGFRYDRLAPLLFDPLAFRHAPAMHVDAREGQRWRLVARGVAGGRGKTMGFHERTDVTFAGETVRALLSGERQDRLARIAAACRKDVKEVLRALSFGVCVAASGGEGSADDIEEADRERAYPYLRRLNTVVDARFFETVEARFLAPDDASATLGRREFVRALVLAAMSLLDEVTSAVSGSVRRHRARSRAFNGFWGTLRRSESAFRDQSDIVGPSWPDEPHSSDGVNEPGKLSGVNVVGIARDIADLEPAQVSALRRGPLDQAGAAAFWAILASRAPEADPEGCAALVQAIAILTLTSGRSPRRLIAHDQTRSMGHALFVADVSEPRLDHLLSAPPATRRLLVVRLCRRLAVTGPRQFDLWLLARYLLVADDRTSRRISRDYYRADAVAARTRGEAATDG
ncbi:MAG: hypothetical protein OXG72_19405 [Acidobacteria bacterium]|nr:hypothetical protein [Acidobacteriota bacterium]